MKPRIRICLAGLLTLLPASAIACPGLEVSGLWIREAPPAASTMVAYMDLSNTGTQPLVIDHIAGADFGGSMLHSTVVVDGISKMRHVDELDLPAGESRALSPGGLHLMLFRPARPLRSGDTSELTVQCGDQQLALPAPVLKSAP